MSSTLLSKVPHDPLPRIYWGLFFIVVPLIALWMAKKPVAQVEIPVLTHDLPTYHIIKASEVVTKSIDAKEVITDTVRDPDNLVNHYTRNMLRANQPIRTSQVGVIADLQLISDTIAVALPVNTSTLLTGNIRAGDIVSLAVVPFSYTTSTPEIVFNELLILDVITEGQDTVIVIAIPTNRWLEYLAKMHNVTFVLARRVD